LQRNLKRLRNAQRLGLTAAVSAVAVLGLTVGTAKPALAEFEIQESNVEKGEVQLSYRGAVHWGIPKAEEGDAAALRQSHDLEMQWGATQWLLLSLTLTADQPLGEDFALSAVELETQVELIERKGSGIGLAFQGGYGFATRGSDADEIQFGPIVELAAGKLLLTLNPLFGAQVGDNRQTDGLGFEYGWRAEYDFAKHWGVGVEMFGQIDDLANAGSFNDQEHSLGPTLFYNPGSDDDDGKGGGGDDDNKNVGGPPQMEFSLNVGVQFGLTDVTSDTALKFQGELSF
jgi:hypothetical protein